jgi:endonuclease YncB( thermonuclease family)
MQVAFDCLTAGLVAPLIHAKTMHCINRVVRLRIRRTKSPLPLLALALLVLLSGQAAHAGECKFVASRDTVVESGAFGEIRLASGRVVTLSDVRIAEPVDDALHFLASQAGAEVELQVRESKPDRWGRIGAAIILSPDASRVDLAHALIARGLAVVDSQAQTLCDESLLLREEQARRSRRGLWRAVETLPVPAENSAALLARLGSFTIVEGVVQSIGERGRRTYLDFGRSWEGAFTVIIPSPLWTKVQSAGMGVDTLKGRRIRIRGIMQNWRGPAIELTTVEFIEYLEARPLRP